jgi:hypothetical protein
MRYVLFLLVLTSCSTVYMPNTRNAPLFREKGEAQVSGYLCSGGLEGQLAYALTNNFALIGSYAYGTQKNTYTNTSTAPSTTIEYDWKNSNGQIGLGYYDRTRSTRFEIFAGMGFGQGTSLDQYSFFGLNNNVVATGKKTYYFLQPSIGTNNQNFNIIFTPRFTYQTFSEFSTAVATIQPSDNGHIFIEPALTAKFRLAGNLHGIFQLGLTLPVPSEVYYEYSSLQAALGVQIDTGGMRTTVYDGGSGKKRKKK